jgi:integrase
MNLDRARNANSSASRNPAITTSLTPGRQIWSIWHLGRNDAASCRAGIGHWHAHEGRHTAASIMSSNGVPIQDLSDTVGHKSTHVTETVYRHVIVPTIRGGATVMDDIFSEPESSAG